MYCYNCGKELNDDAKFCRYCGTKFGDGGNVNLNSNVNVNSNRQPVSDNKTTKIIILIVTGVIALLIIIFGLIALTSKNKTSNSSYQDSSTYSNSYSNSNSNYNSSSSSSSSSGSSSSSSKSKTGTGSFSIEGKWKSVGSEGFGQAQPGSIVYFDGANCNFFSPQDTYAFYKSGSSYVLDVTSYLTSQNLSFTVNVIDNNNIEVKGSGRTTTLKRMN